MIELKSATLDKFILPLEEDVELQPNPKVDQVLNYKNLHTIFKEEIQKDGFEINPFIIDCWPDFHEE